MSVLVVCNECGTTVKENITCYRCGGELELVDNSKKSNVTFCKKCRRSCLVDDYEIKCPDCEKRLLFFVFTK